MRDRLLYIAGGLAIVLIAYNLAQTAAQPREALFYIPLAGTAALAAFTALAASLLFLGSRNFQFDSLAVAVTEASIVNGCFLLHAATGRWWNWDSRLTAALVCWLLYATYLMLRHAVQDPTERAAFSAVWSIFAFLDIPMVAATIKWWRSVSSLRTDWSGARLWNLVAMILVGILLTVVRMRQEEARRELDSLRRITHAI
jgi:heme exporter protein C